MRRLTMCLLAALALPALANAQGNRERNESHARARHTRTAGGEVGLQSGMTRGQIEQLQQALSNDGCNPGPADGRIGPRTRRAIACSRQKHSLTGNNTNELLRTLNLNFTVDDSTGMGGMMRHRGDMRDTTGEMSDTSNERMRGMMRGKMRGGMRDSTRMRDTTGRMRGNPRGTMRGNPPRPRDTTRPDTTR